MGSATAALDLTLKVQSQSHPIFKILYLINEPTFMRYKRFMRYYEIKIELY